MHGFERLMRGKPRCTLLINPIDAEARGLADQDTATVTSRVGSVTVTVAVTEDVMPGVVSLPHGYGHTRAGTRLSVADAHAGVSINDLTDDQLVDQLTGTAAFSGTPVTVSSVKILS
jgi:anaerobic selenocysteine-containing dehydrogenase